jgi:hypothetical protein
LKLDYHPERKITKHPKKKIRKRIKLSIQPLVSLKIKNQQLLNRGQSLKMEKLHENKNKLTSGPAQG